MSWTEARGTALSSPKALAQAADLTSLIRGETAIKVEEDMERARILVDINTMEQAERVEESIRTGYVEAIIENLVNWIAVEEDLAESYEKFSNSLTSAKERETANKLLVLSSSDADILRMKLGEFEGFENEHKKRIQLVKKLSKSV